MPEPAQYPAAPPYRDEQPPPPTGPPTQPAHTGFPLSIVLLPVVGAFFVSFTAIIAIGIIVNSAWDASGSEGAAIAVIALFVVTIVMVWPMAFAGLFVWMMRRNERDKPALLAVVTAVGLLPALIVGSRGVTTFTANRGLRTTGIVTVLVLVVLALTWVLAVLGSQRWRNAIVGTVITALVVTFSIVAANLNADAHDRSLEREAISGENAPLALFDSRGALAERDGWVIADVDTIFFERSRRYGRLGIRIENPAAARSVSVAFHSVEDGGHCGPSTTCQPLLTLDDGTVVHGDPGPVGTFFDFPAPRNTGWWTVYTSHSMSAPELIAAVELLQPVTVDAWIAAQDRFGN